VFHLKNAVVFLSWLNRLKICTVKQATQIDANGKMLNLFRTEEFSFFKAT